MVVIVTWSFHDSSFVSYLFIDELPNRSQVSKQHQWDNKSW